MTRCCKTNYFCKEFDCSVLVNTSYNDKKINQEIDTLVGAPFGFFERIKIGGVGSPQMRIRTASKEILSLLNKNTNRDIANIELRPKGIIVRFHSRLENYALVIPYFKLNLFKGEKDSSAVFCDQHKITFEIYNKEVSNFIKRLLSEKAKQTSSI